MRLEGNNIVLEILTAESAEIVRKWRNKPEIREQMDFQELISEKAQQKWFRELDEKTCKYFIIKRDNHPIGMIDVHAINEEAKSGETGLFIGDSQYSGTGITLGASLLLLSYCFDELNLTQVVAKVRDTNVAAQQYNQLLGFEKIEEINEFFTLFQLTKVQFEKKKKHLVKLIA